MKVLAANLAYTFHFQPSELNKFTEDDFLEWSEQSERIRKEIKRQTSKTGM